MRRRMPPRPRPREPSSEQVYPVDMNLVKGILREFDRGAYGEEFRGDRLARIAVLGKGMTSTVWKVVDVDYLRVVAVKEMVVCDSKQSGILRHELSVLHPQLQCLIPPKKFRLSGRKSGNRAAVAAAAASVSKMRAAEAASEAAAAAASSSNQRKNSGKDARGGGGGGGKDQARWGGGGGSSGKKGTAAAATTAASSGGAPLERPGKCAYMPRYFGSFVSQDDAGRPCVSMVLEHVSGVNLSRWIEKMGGTGKVGDGDKVGDGVGDQPAAAAAATATATAAMAPQAPGTGTGTGTLLPTPTPTPTSPTAAPPSRPASIQVPEVWLARVCRDMLEALRYLHDRRRIHRDVKPGNLVLGPEGARLVDFGSTIGESEDEGDRMHGTIRFMSPERLCAKPYRPSSDLWAAGLTVASAALGENPIPHSQNKFENAEYAEAAFRLVLEHPASSGLSPSLLGFLKAALEADPDRRPTVEQMLSHPFVRPSGADGEGGDLSGDFVGGGGGRGGGGGGGSGGGFLGAVRRGGSVLNLGGRRKDGERARTAAAALENKEKQKRQQNQQRQQRILSSPFSSHSSSAGGAGAGADRLEEAWTEQVRETLRRLARESTSDVDASELIRRVLTARKSRWGNPMGSGDISLKYLDYSFLAAELDVSGAELRSLFGTLLTNMDGESSGSWGSPVSSPRSSSPPPAMLPPLGAAAAAAAIGGSGGIGSSGSKNRSRSNSREIEGGGGAPPSPSPLRLPYSRRDPFPRRRPTPLILSPGAGTPRPISASALSSVSGMTAQSATGGSPTATAAAATAAPAPTALPTTAAPAEAEVEESSPQSLTVRRSVSATTWTRGWSGMNRSRRPGDSRRSVSGVFATRYGVAGAGGAGGGGAGGGWWKWGHRRRLLPRVFKAEKPGVGGAGAVGVGAGGSGAEEVRTTEPPSAASRATATAASQPPFAVTPPLSKFDEDKDGSVGGSGGGVESHPPAVSERDVGLGAVRAPLTPGPGAVAGVGVCDGPAPVWTSTSVTRVTL